MNTKRFCDLAHVSPGTFRNWAATFAPFLSPQASPAKGKTRVLSDHDLRVLYFVSTLRDTGLGIADITDRLKDLQRKDWEGLPSLPAEWADLGESVSVGVAVSKAYDIAQIAVLQRDLEYTRAELETAHHALEAAQQKVTDLENDMNALRTSQTATEAEKAEMRLELERARGQVTALEARLSAYAITGGDKPIPVAVIIAVTALVAVVIVALVFVLARLLL